MTRTSDAVVAWIVFTVLMASLLGLEGFLFWRNDFWALGPVSGGYLLGLLRMRRMANQGEEEEELKHVASPPRPIRTPRVSYRRQR
jgi:hypothetical protein